MPILFLASIFPNSNVFLVLVVEHPVYVQKRNFFRRLRQIVRLADFFKPPVNLRPCFVIIYA